MKSQRERACVNNKLIIRLQLLIPRTKAVAQVEGKGYMNSYNVLIQNLHARPLLTLRVKTLGIYTHTSPNF